MAFKQRVKAKQLIGEQLVYDIGGRKYLLVERMITYSNEDRERQKMKGLGAIEQGIKKVSTEGNGYIIAKYLLPISKLNKFQNKQFRKGE